ncbi:hypothetical protein BJX64DRAFT_289555 [Aspergillus heterothallicus]
MATNSNGSHGYHFLVAPTPTPIEIPSSLIPSVFPSSFGVSPTPTPTPGVDLDPADFPVFFGPDDALIALLEPSETAVWCYDIVTYTTGIPAADNAATTTEGLLALVTATTTGSVLTTSIPAAQASDFVAVSVVPPLVLVHKPTDLADGGGEGEEESMFTGAAARIGVAGAGIWGGGIAGVAAAVAVSMMAGCALVFVQ